MSRKRRSPEEMEQEANQQILDEIDKEAKAAMLPGVRLMTVITRRGAKIYEYASFTTGRRVTLPNGNWYHAEVRYPLNQDGGMDMPKKRRTIAPDVRDKEELSEMGIPDDQITVEKFIDLLRRKAEI